MENERGNNARHAQSIERRAGDRARWNLITGFSICHSDSISDMTHFPAIYSPSRSRCFSFFFFYIFLILINYHMNTYGASLCSGRIRRQSGYYLVNYPSPVRHEKNICHRRVNDIMPSVHGWGSMRVTTKYCNNNIAYLP